METVTEKGKKAVRVPPKSSPDMDDEELIRQEIGDRGEGLRAKRRRLGVGNKR